MHFNNNEINSIAASGVLEALSAAWRRAFDIEWIGRVKTVARQSSEVASTQKTNLLRHWVLQEVGIERCNDYTGREKRMQWKYRMVSNISKANIRMHQ